MASRTSSSKGARDSRQPSVHVVPHNILAAGALNYVYNLGERLGILRLADALVLRWTSGTFNVEPGASSADLQRYWNMRSERVSPDKRAMVYRLILAKGKGEILSGVAENQAFPNLWGTLMLEAAEFLEQSSRQNVSADRQVSRQPVYQATQQLQCNLTEHAPVTFHVQISEMCHHLLEATNVLEHAADYFTRGSRKSVWTVIDRASREWFGETPNISAIRSAAFHGNTVFQWIADFDQSNVTDEQFQTFIAAAEAWITAQATDPDPTLHQPGETNAESDEDSVDSGESDWDP